MRFADKFMADKKELLAAIEAGDKDTIIWLYDYAVYQVFSCNGFANFYNKVLMDELDVDENGLMEYFSKKYDNSASYMKNISAWVKKSSAGYKSGGDIS